MKKIVMIGTRFDTMGGISSVVNVYRAAGLFDRYNIRYIATHCDGGKFAKLRISVGALLTFLWLLISGQVDLAHIHVSSRASFWRKLPFFTLAHLAGRATIVHLHSGAFHHFYDKCSSRGKAAIRYMFDNASRVIVLSDTWKTWAQTISTNRAIVAIYNPVQVPPETRSLRNAAPVVLMLGRIGQPKGSYDLLEATVPLAAAVPALQLRLGGDGDLERASARAAELGIARNVNLLGWVVGDAKHRELATARVYVLPSYNEGLPMSVLEAMAAGLPVVTTPVGGIPEAVTDGVEGYLIQPGDQEALRARVEALLRDDELAERMGQAARRKIQTTFSVEAILPRIEAIYAELGITRAAPVLATRPLTEKQ
ncbi:glycosyltransferase family 4 protein [Massilia sp. METH4]|uniref:glycosyltransferase family 4 protein n=1 Tax=Massilia sp. METH4 TaxID=3123041 RepID=UPI0030CF425B